MDEDGSSFTFSLMPTDQFSIGSTSGVVEVATGATLDREVNNMSGTALGRSCPQDVIYETSTVCPERRDVETVSQ